MFKSQSKQLLQMSYIIQVFKTYTAGGRGEKINKTLISEDWNISYYYTLSLIKRVKSYLRKRCCLHSLRKERKHKLLLGRGTGWLHDGSQEVFTLVYSLYLVNFIPCEWMFYGVIKIKNSGEIQCYLTLTMNINLEPIYKMNCHQEKKKHEYHSLY